MYQIAHDVKIHCFKEDLYELVSTAAGLQQWWTFQSEGVLGINNEYRLFFSEKHDWKAKIMEFSENESISFLMTQSPEDWRQTIVSFELMDLQNHEILLRFEHRNWREINDYFRESSFYWAMYLNDLKKLAEKMYHNKAG
jgi:hypothetical protein